MDDFFSFAYLLMVSKRKEPNLNHLGTSMGLMGLYLG